jgi:hypothetical protein
MIFGLGSAPKATPIERLAKEPAELDDIVVVEVPDDPAGDVKDMEVKVVAICDTLLPGWFGISGVDEDVVVVEEVVEESNAVAISDTFLPGGVAIGDADEEVVVVVAVEEANAVAIIDTLLSGNFGIIGVDEDVVVVEEAVEEANTFAICDTFDPGTLGRGFGLCVGGVAGREPEVDGEDEDPDTLDIRNILG